MALLSLNYSHCDHLRPRYLNNAHIEAVARQARDQLQAQNPALHLDALAGIAQLHINDVRFDLWVDLEHPLNDEAGKPVLGLCEFDSTCGENAVSLMVSPISQNMSAELALSTFAHELGHAIFDAPAWLIAAKAGQGLFDEAGTSPRQYRTATASAEHLKIQTNDADPPEGQNPSLEKATRIAEYRANEFMGSFLVPRKELVALAAERAPGFNIGVKWLKGLNEFLHSGVPLLIERGESGSSDRERLQRDLATNFGVTPRFIEVRLQRYGLVPSSKV